MNHSLLDNETLHGLLTEAGSALTVEQLRALVDGVVAAPDDYDAEAWMGLVAAQPTSALRAALAALKQSAKAACDDGLDASPAPAERLAALRAELAALDLDGFVVPRADPQHSEFLPRAAERLQWLTGFSGSAGVAVVLAHKAAIFIDGRYTLAVESQIDTDAYERRHVTDDPPDQWIAGNLDGGRLGYDPWLHTPDGLKKLATACAKAGGHLVACDSNPIDVVWVGQPPSPVAPLLPHDVKYAGQSAADKREAVAESLREAGTGACVLSVPDSIAWLLNLRGGDVPFSPFALGFAILHDDARVELFMDGRKLAPGTLGHLGDEVALRGPDDLGPALDSLARANRPVQADPAGTSAWIFDRVDAAGGEVRRVTDPCDLPRARKNAVELDGARAAHHRDGGALTAFLRWIDETAADSPIDEIGAAAFVDGQRARNDNFRGLSFPTIAGSGPNGAIVHYNASEATNRTMSSGELLLVDSGGQYLDGTTDVTRTMAIGTPSAEQRRHFTAVLKGHIALGTCLFPVGTTGSQLDVLARHALWQMGLDYDHGTGHGVGSYLGVHEGPHRISKVPSRVALEPGMVVSNEPGYYRTGAYGIRIENLVCVIEAPRPEGGERDMLAFETLTRAPFDRKLIDTTMLTADETAWIDSYHAEVCTALTPELDADTAAWLATATRSLSQE
jgi:Xaa-Pro aminopeptidase